MPTELVLVDLSSIFVPAWKAIPASEPASAPHDVTVARIRRIGSEHEHVAVCLDVPPYKRRELYADYKANRKATPEEVADREAMQAQLALVADTLRRDGFPVFGVQGLEADDVIASLVKQSAGRDLNVTIISGDKDLHQLVGPGVVVQSPRYDAEGKPLPAYGVDEVTARYGVGPELVGDWLALTGDASDGIPGVPRVGPKTATGLLKDFGSLDAVIEAAALGDEKIKPALRALLCEHSPQARVSRALVALLYDDAVSIDEALKPRAPQALRGAEDTDEPDDWAGEPDEEEETMSEQQTQTEAPAPAPEPPPAAKPVIEHEPPAVQRAPADAVDRLAAFIPEPGSDAWAAALEPTSVEGAWRVATKIFNARLFGFANVEQCFAAIMLGRSLGVGVMTACRNVHIVKGGKLALHVDLMVGIVKRSPLCVYWSILETTKEQCTIETQRKGAPKPFKLTYTLDDAIDAQSVPRNGGGTDSTWGKFRRQMIRHGCEREVARAEYQDLTAGLYTPEDFADYSDLPAPPRAA